MADSTSPAPWLGRPPMTLRDIERELRPWAESSDDDEAVAAAFILDRLDNLPIAVSVETLRQWFDAETPRRSGSLFGPARSLRFSPRSRLICNELLARIHSRDLRANAHG